MKVALVCDWYHPRVGGIELHLQDLAARLQRAGHEVVVITPTPGDETVNDIRVIRVDAPLAPHFGFLITAAGVRAIGTALVRERVDVAHCHVSIVSPAALGGAAQAVEHGIPAVITCHSMVPHTRILASATARALGTTSWPVRFSAVSKVIAHEVEPIAGKRNISILSNGVDTAFWRDPPPSRNDTETLQLISVLRLNPKKSADRLLVMMDTLRRLSPGVGPVRMRIVGDGPQRRLMETTIERLNLTQHVELLGTKSRDDIRALLSESDVFVSPAVRESFGLAALEARCVGLPVVAMKSSGVSEFIRHEREGLLADSHDELASCVATLARDQQLRQRIAAHNHETPPAYDWSTVLADHLAIYREAIALRESAAAENAT